MVVEFNPELKITTRITKKFECDNLSLSVSNGEWLYRYNFPVKQNNSEIKKYLKTTDFQGFVKGLFEKYRRVGFIEFCPTLKEDEKNFTFEILNKLKDFIAD